jgi:hypothetical protein
MTRNPVALPLATITSARAVEGGWIVTDAQGEEHNVSKVAWDIAVEGTPSAMLPAQPGTYLLNPNPDHPEDQPRFWKTNVLGWMVCADTEIRPVTLDPEGLLSPPWQVLHPDGRVERSDASNWERVEEWLEEVARVRERVQEQA